MGEDSLEEAIELCEQMSVEIRRLRREVDELKEDNDEVLNSGGPGDPPSPA